MGAAQRLGMSRLGLPRLPARTCASGRGIGLTDSTFWEPDISARVGVTELPSRRPSLTPALRRTRRTFFFDPRMHTQLPRLTASRTTGRPFTGSADLELRPVDPTQKEEVRPASDVV